MAVKWHRLGYTNLKQTKVTLMLSETLAQDDYSQVFGSPM
jgi:hypothetical protein